MGAPNTGGFRCLSRFREPQALLSFTGPHRKLAPDMPPAVGHHVHLTNRAFCTRGRRKT
jgi:hypothetical protein